MIKTRVVPEARLWLRGYVWRISSILYLYPALSLSLFLASQLSCIGREFILHRKIKPFEIKFAGYYVNFICVLETILLIAHCQNY